MHYSTILATLLSATAVSATPLKRACTEQYPASLGFPINFNISKTISPPTEQKADIAFNIPPNAGGPCSLIVKFPAGYPIKKSGASRLEVRDLNGPVAGSLVGAIDLASDPNAETVRTINSFACRPLMSYELTIESDTQGGSVSFSEIKNAGFIMTYGC